MIGRARGSVVARLSVGFVAAALLLSGCKLKKDETDEPVKVPEKKASADATASSAPSAAPDASSAPATPASASSTAPSSSSATPEAPTPGVGENAGIDKCCTALNAVQSSGVGKDSKKKSAAAALACGGISKLVKSGRTSRGAALIQVKAALAGASVPPACD